MHERSFGSLLCADVAEGEALPHVRFERDLVPNPPFAAAPPSVEYVVAALAHAVVEGPLEGRFRLRRPHGPHADAASDRADRRTPPRVAQRRPERSASGCAHEAARHSSPQRFLRRAPRDLPGQISTLFGGAPQVLTTVAAKGVDGGGPWLLRDTSGKEQQKTRTRGSPSLHRILLPTRSSPGPLRRANVVPPLPGVAQRNSQNACRLPCELPRTHAIIPSRTVPIAPHFPWQNAYAGHAQRTLGSRDHAERAVCLQGSIGVHPRLPPCANPSGLAKGSGCPRKSEWGVVAS